MPRQVANYSMGAASRHLRATTQPHGQRMPTSTIDVVPPEKTALGSHFTRS